MLFKNSIANGEGKVVAWVMITVVTYFDRTPVVQKDPKTVSDWVCAHVHSRNVRIVSAESKVY